MARATPAAIFEPFRYPCEHERTCGAPGCGEEGLYRAPVARDRLDEYYWFCLEHVRQYNASWDYFGGMSEAEIEAIRRNDTVWQRPSWPMGQSYLHAEAEVRVHIWHEFGPGHANGGRSTAGPRPQSEEEKALAMLDLSASASFTEVKVRYKKLAKRLHPDANGGDREAEERLKEINQAYTTLKKSRSQDLRARQA